MRYHANSPVHQASVSLFRRKPDREALSAQVRELAAALLERRGLVREISFDDPLGAEGLGLDSVSQLELLADVEKHCGVIIPEPYWGSRPLRSLKHLVDVAR